LFDTFNAGFAVGNQSRKSADDFFLRQRDANDPRRRWENFFCFDGKCLSGFAANILTGLDSSFTRGAIRIARIDDDSAYLSACFGQ